MVGQCRFVREEGGEKAQEPDFRGIPAWGNRIARNPYMAVWDSEMLIGPAHGSRGWWVTCEIAERSAGDRWEPQPVSPTGVAESVGGMVD